jgi:uncharacterized membrane protein
METQDLAGILLRWIHVISAISLLGGMILARVALVPAGQSALLGRYRQVVLASIAGLVLSGLYNLLAKPGVPPGYHAVFGIKVLLALHIFSVGWLATSPSAPDSKRARWLTGIVISGIILAGLSSYLRWLSH